MTDLWIVQVTSVDRSQREIRFWLLRVYPGLALPRSYSFFCALLYQMFRDRGMFGVEQIKYEESSLFKPTGELPEGLEFYDGGGTANNPHQFIEQVEMLRWCGPDPLTIEPIRRKTRNGLHVDYSEQNTYEEETKLTLQAEYLVRVTDEAYISARADPPSFMGNFFFDTAMYDIDDGTHISLGPRQEELIYPLEQFVVETEESQAAKLYAEENLATMEQLVAAIPKVLRNGPTSFSADSFHNLSSQDKHLMISILAFAKRNDGTVFNSLPDRGSVFHILSFLSIDDSPRQAELRRIYLSFEPWYEDSVSRWLFRALRESSMRRHALQNILRGIAHHAKEIDTALADPAPDSDLESFHDRALEFGHQLQRILDALDRLTLPNMDQLFLGKNPIEWMRKRLRAFQNRTSSAEFWQHIYRVSPDDLHPDVV